MAAAPEGVRKLAHRVHADAPTGGERYVQRIFQALHEEFLVDVDMSVLSLDSTCVKVHPDGTGAPQKGSYFDRKGR